MTDNPSVESSRPSQAEENELCPGCLTPNAPATHFCTQCGAPLSSFAATGPFESLFAEGHVYRQTVEQPVSLLVVVGVCLIFGMISMVGLSLAFSSLHAGTLTGLLPGLFFIGIAVAVIAKSISNYSRKTRLVTATDDRERAES